MNSTRMFSYSVATIFIPGLCGIAWNAIIGIADLAGPHFTFWPILWACLVIIVGVLLLGASSDLYLDERNKKVSEALASELARVVAFALFHKGRGTSPRVKETLRALVEGHRRTTSSLWLQPHARKLSDIVLSDIVAHVRLVTPSRNNFFLLSLSNILNGSGPTGRDELVYTMLELVRVRGGMEQHRLVAEIEGKLAVDDLLGPMRDTLASRDLHREIDRLLVEPGLVESSQQSYLRISPKGEQEADRLRSLDCRNLLAKASAA